MLGGRGIILCHEHVLFTDVWGCRWLPFIFIIATILGLSFDVGLTSEGLGKL